MPYFYWLYCLPLGSAALTPIGPLRPRPRPTSRTRAVGRGGKRAGRLLWAVGRRWRRRRRRRRRSWVSRRQRRRPRWGDGAGAWGRCGAAWLRGAWSGVRSAAASLPGAGGREDAEQVDERQQQEPGARVQLHRAAAGRQRVHLHHPGQCRAAPPAGPPRPPSLANLARARASLQTPALCPPLAAADGPGAGRLCLSPSPGLGTRSSALLRGESSRSGPPPRPLPSPEVRTLYPGSLNPPVWGAPSSGVGREALSPAAPSGGAGFDSLARQGRLAAFLTSLWLER